MKMSLIQVRISRNTFKDFTNVNLHVKMSKHFIAIIRTLILVQHNGHSSIIKFKHITPEQLIRSFRPNLFVITNDYHIRVIIIIIKYLSKDF